MYFARSFVRASGPEGRSSSASAAAALAAGGSAAGAVLTWTSERLCLSTTTSASASSAAAGAASTAAASLPAGRIAVTSARSTKWMQPPSQRRLWTATSPSSAGSTFTNTVYARVPHASVTKPKTIFNPPSWNSHGHRRLSGTPAASPSPTFVAWYESKLQSFPIPTKMLTGGILWSVGDAVAQVVPPLTHGDSSLAFPDGYDWARTGRAGLFGFAIHAPTSHLHFNFLEWMTVRSGFTGLQIPFFKAFMEQFVYWSWVSNSMYHAAMGAMQGMSLQQIYSRIEDVLWDTQKAQWVFWIPVQLLNFRYVPVRHQLNVVLVTSVVWTALLSMWYPPTKSEPVSNENDKAAPSAASH